MMRGGGNMQQMMKQMQKMQKNGSRKEKLKDERHCRNSWWRYGAVTVTGHKEVVDVEIKEEAVDPDDMKCYKI